MLSRMRRWVSPVVAEKKEGRRSSRSLSVVNEKGSGSGSLSCRISREKSIVEARNRGGVPVFILPISKPSAFIQKASSMEAISPARPAGYRVLSDVDQTAEKCPGRDDHGPTGVKDAGLIDHAADPPAIDDQLLHQALTQVEVFLLLHDGLHCKAVELLVALEARGLDRRPFRGVEEAKVDSGPVGDTAHLTAKGVDLLDELALGEAADRGIAGHERERIEVDVEQKGLAAHPGRREGRLAARMTPSDDDDIIFFFHIRPSGLRSLLSIPALSYRIPKRTLFPVMDRSYGNPCSSLGNLI